SPQSSLHSEEGLGVASLSVIYAALILSSMFLPPILIKKLGCKWTIAGSMCCYIAYSLGNFYASCAAFEVSEVTLSQTCITEWRIWSPGYESLLHSFAPEQGGYNTPPYQNIVEVSAEDLMCCGAYDCMTNATANTTASSGPTKTLIYILLGVYTGSGVIAVLLIALFLDQIKANQAESETEKMQTQAFWTTFLATFQHLKDKRQCLLIPLTMYSGFEQAFLAGDYTKSYVTCALGIHFVGYVMMSFSATNSLCSLFFGKISQFTGRKALFALALYGVLFEKHKEAAFANYRLWESLGFVIAFGYSTFFHVYVKLYIVMAVLVVAIATYGTVEYLEAKDLPGKPTTVKEEITGSVVQQTRL
ncbi:Protein unc-93 like protein A, partial [Chelonia mydas]